LPSCRLSLGPPPIGSSASSASWIAETVGLTPSPETASAPAHWLSWRVGLSLGTARQYVCVARVLPDLERISAAFGAGELSYSKVRAITPDTGRPTWDGEPVDYEWSVMLLSQ
jgi:Domain of unknown function (DUF222)